MSEYYFVGIAVWYLGMSMEMVNWTTKKNEEVEDKYGVIHVAHWSDSGWLQYLDRKENLWTMCQRIKYERGFWRGSYLIGDSKKER